MQIIKPITVLAISMATGIMLSACQWPSLEPSQDKQTQAEQTESTNDVSEPNSPAQAYHIGTVTAHTIPQSIILGGTVLPRTEVTLSAQMPGRIAFVAGKEGTELEKDQLVIGLDDDDLLAKRRAAKADLTRAMSQLQNAHVQLTQQIYGGNGPAQGGMGMPSMFDKFFTKPFSNSMGYGDQNLDRYANINNAKTGVEGAQTAVVQAQARIDELDTKLRDKVSKSPGKAVIMEKFVEVGDIVQPGQRLARIADADNLQIKVEVPTRYMGGLSKGLMIPVKIDQQMKLDTILEQVYPAADPQRHTITIKLALPPGAPVTPGMYADVQIPDFSNASTPLPVVPKSAVLWRGGQSTLFIVNEDHNTQMRLVRLGDDLGDSIIVLSGVWPGERFIVNPPPMMRSGTAITPQSTGPWHTPMQVPAPNASYPPARMNYPSGSQAMMPANYRQHPSRLATNRP